VVVVRVAFVCWLRTVTSALGTTAPLLSFTLPAIDPFCAHAASEHKTTMIRGINLTTLLLDIVFSSFRNNRMGALPK
jgi:hypothetical protein